MSAEWSTYTLGELGEIKTGKTPPSKISDAFDGKIPFITPRDMDGRKWIDSTERYLSDAGVDAVKSSLVPQGSVAVSCIGSDMGKAVLLSQESVTNQQINTIIVDQTRFNPEFVYYDLSLRQQELKGMASGSATPILNKGHFSKVAIRLPEKALQDEIVGVLSTLDDKIEINRQINQTLEQISQTIFKSWFVDFEPVKAKLEAKAAGSDPERAAMCAISGKLEPELDQLSPEQYQQLTATATLFPDALVESELGLIPEGWDVFNVEDLCRKVGMGPFGSNIKVSTFVESGIPVVSGQHLHSTMMEDNTFNFVTEEHAGKLASSNVFRGDVVFTHAGNIGQVSYIPVSSKYEQYVLSQRQFFLRCDTSKMSPIFITYFFRSPIGQYKLLANSSQVGVPSIARPVSYLKSIKLVSPNKLLIDSFDFIVRNLHHLMSVGLAEIETLSALRDSMLPRLLSGKLLIGHSIE